MRCCLSTGGKGRAKEAKGRSNQMAVANKKPKVTTPPQRTRPKRHTQLTQLNHQRAFLANRRTLLSLQKFAMAVQQSRAQKHMLRQTAKVEASSVRMLSFQLRSHCLLELYSHSDPSCSTDRQSPTSFPEQPQNEMGLKNESAAELELKSPRLRDLDFNLLQSGKLMLTGTSTCSRWLSKHSLLY